MKRKKILAKPNRGTERTATGYGNSQKLLERALADQRAGRIEEAEQGYRRVLEVNPLQPDAMRLLGALLVDTSRSTEAVELLSKANQHHKNFAALLVGFGNALMAERRYSKAAEVYRKALDIQPKFVMALTNLAMALQELDQLEEAIVTYRRAIAAGAQHASTFSNLGNALHDARQNRKAKTAYEKALQLDNACVMALVGLGNISQQQGQVDDAIEHYCDALGAHAGHPLALRNLGNAYQSKGRPDLALACFNEYLVTHPEDLAVQHLRSALAGENPAQPPAEYVARLFDDYAPRFEEHLTKDLGYDLPTRMRNVVQRVLENAGRTAHEFANGLDLGCGTGLCGVAFEGMVQRLHGLDLSPRMVRIARQKTQYQSVEVDEMMDFLERDDDASCERFDLILAADVLVYVGALGQLFRAVWRRMRNQGDLFVFSIESKEDADYRLLPSGRYGHGQRYVEAEARAAGFELIECEPVALRAERDLTLEGRLYVLAAA